MNLLINSERLLGDILEDFSHEYPYLKLEFFKKGVANGQQISKILPHYLSVKEVWTGGQGEGNLQVDDAMTVWMLEQTLLLRFGLQAHLFRRFGNLWLETTMTDKWTLGQQNNHGREISLGSPGPAGENNYNVSR